MSPMNLTPEQLQTYIIAAKKREKSRLVKLEERRKRGLKIAKEGAKLLKKQFGITTVILFGSLLTDKFHETSDIDLAVSDLPPKCYFKAVGCLLALGEFDFDLVEISQARPEIAKAIAKGIIL
ncbi:MAG: nucleotidyltransferase family protein [Xenococcus sp. (in: cyanobacteria)]